MGNLAAQIYRDFSRNLYLTLCGISIITGSFILAGRTLFDEFLFVLVAIYCLFQLFIQKNYKIVKFKNSKLELIALFYLFTSTVINLLINPNFSSTRFTIIYFTFLVISLYLSQHEQNIDVFRVKTLWFFSIYLYLWITYWILLSLIGIDWQVAQAHTFAGSSYAAIIPMAGMFLWALALRIKPTKLLWRLFGLNFSLTLLAAQLYDSRALFLSLLILALILCFSRYSLRFVATILLAFVAAVAFSNLLNFLGFDKQSDALPWYVSQISVAPSNVQLLNDPRESDEDRSQSIKCATEKLLRNSSAQHLIFGYGHNNHKTVLVECWPEINRTIVRPVGYAAFIIDFGLFGIIAISSLFTKRVIQILKSRTPGRLISITVFTLLMMWSLVTNYLDHSFIYIVLFTNFLLDFSKSRSMNAADEPPRP